MTKFISKKGKNWLTYITRIVANVFLSFSNMQIPDLQRTVNPTSLLESWNTT